MTGNEKKVQDWSYIRLSDSMLARSRLRKNQQQQQQQQQQKSMDGSVATMVSDESKVLRLEAQVVCASSTDQPIRMCVGCVRREVRLLMCVYFLILFTNCLVSNRENERNEQKTASTRETSYPRTLRQREIASCCSIVAQ